MKPAPLRESLLVSLPFFGFPSHHIACMAGPFQLRRVDLDPRVVGRSIGRQTPCTLQIEVPDEGIVIGRGDPLLELLQRLQRVVLPRHHHEPIEGEEKEITPAPLTDWREIPLEALERKELREALRSAVAELPGIYRQIFTLRDLEELNVAETAAALGINENMVKVRLHRARMMLQKTLAPYLKSAVPAKAPAKQGFWRRMPWN